MATLIRPPGPTQGMGASDTGEQCKCLACGLAFDAMHTLKEHYRGDLHRCNLKRKVQGLLPLSAADFQSRSEELVAPAVQPAGKEKRSRKLSKEARQRVKQEERARRQQEKLLKMQERVEAASQPESVTISSEQAEALMLEERIAAAPKLQLTQCIFSGRNFDTFEEALTHMARQYGFFIPDPEHLCDPEGLVEYLRGKATIGYTCWYCEKGFHSWEAVRGHMIDRSHCKLPYDGTHPEVEVRAPSSALHWHTNACGVVRSHHRRARSQDFYNFNGSPGGVGLEGFAADSGDGGGIGGDSSGDEQGGGEQDHDDDDDDWEEVHDSDEIAEVERNTSQLAVQETAATRRAAGKAALNLSVTSVSSDSVPELVLKDGRRLGHRSLDRYYRQSVRPDTMAPHELIAGLIASYRSMGHQIAHQSVGAHYQMTRAEHREQTQMLARQKYEYMTSTRSRGFHFHGIDDCGHARGGAAPK
jgi:hypothetical protein